MNNHFYLHVDGRYYVATEEWIMETTKKFKDKLTHNVIFNANAKWPDTDYLIESSYQRLLEKGGQFVTSYIPDKYLKAIEIMDTTNIVYDMGVDILYNLEMTAMYWAVKHEKLRKFHTLNTRLANGDTLIQFFPVDRKLYVFGG